MGSTGQPGSGDRRFLPHAVRLLRTTFGQWLAGLFKLSSEGKLANIANLIDAYGLWLNMHGG